jgi:hypothetical protein
MERVEVESASMRISTNEIINIIIAVVGMAAVMIYLHARGYL